MKTDKFLYLFIIYFLLSNFLFAQGIKKSNLIWKGHNIEIVKDEVVIKTKNDINKVELYKKLINMGFKIIDKADKWGIGKLKIPVGTKILDDIDKILATGLVEAAEPIPLGHSLSVPNDPYISSQWGLSSINAFAAWDLTTGVNTDTVGILDSGIQIQNGSLSHPDLQNNNRIIIGNDYTGDGQGMNDYINHGTHVTGILSAETNNQIGIAGVTWNSIIYIDRIIDKYDNGTPEWFYDAVLDEIQHHVKIINYSGGTSSPSVYYTTAIQVAQSNGVLLVMAAGNNNGGSLTYPAAYSTSYANVIAVSATNKEDYIAPFSSTGSGITVAAPGVSIYSTITGSSYGDKSGTSMAAPFVSGLASLILSLNATLTPFQVRQLIEQSADDLGAQGFDNQYGYGRIDALKAVANVYVSKNPEYVFNVGFGILSLNESNIERTFLTEPNETDAAGNYMCDIYTVNVNQNVSLTSPFKVWYLGGKGYSFANPNDCSSYLSENITSNYVNYETVFYYLKTNLTTGGQINRWAPFDPTIAAHRQYATLGIPIPFSAAISGPTNINYGQNYTWTANVAGGNSPYSYQWYYEYPGGHGGASPSTVPNITPDLPSSGTWYTIGSNSPALTAAFYATIYLKCIVTDSKNNSVTSNIITVNIGTSKIANQNSAAANGMNTAVEDLPKLYAMKQNFPNPFNPSTVIHYELPQNSLVTLKVYDVLGNLVNTLVNQYQTKGRYDINFNADNLASGIYFYRLQSGSFISTKKMLLLK